MPIGEIAVLAAAFTFAITSLIQKTLVVRFKPLTLGALNTAGGSLSGLALVLAFGKFDDITQVPIGYLLLGLLGGIINLGLGEPIFFLVLRNVDLSKAWPIVAGMMSVFSLLSGVFILRESPSLVSVAGIFFVGTGVYLLSVAQKKNTDAKQASWLGLKGIFMIAIVAGFWISGLTIQGFALKHIDPLIINMTRLMAVNIFLNFMNSFGLNRILVPIETDVDLSIRQKFMAALSQGTVMMCLRAIRGLFLPKRTVEAISIGSRRRWSARFYNQRSFRWVIVAFVNGSVSLGVASMLFLVGIQRAGLAVSTVLSSTQLFWITLLSVVVLRERINKKALFGVALLFVGVSLIVIR